MFRYGFEAMVYSQYENNPINFEGTRYYPIGTNYKFVIPFWLELVLMGLIGIAIRAVALFVMYKISNPKIMPLLPPLENNPERSVPKGTEVEKKNIKIENVQ
jgi:hypothetical protein